MRGVSLSSQIAVIAASEAERATAQETREYLRAALSKMSNAEMVSTFYKSISGPQSTWPFGTILRHKSMSLDVRAMVLTDDGTLCKVMTLRHGEVVETGRSVWVEEA